jgi:phosphomethylpyrimidine synthase
VTPAEHLGLPTEDEVHQGVIAYRIAAHAADIARGLPGAQAADNAMADARMAFDWKKQFSLAIDGNRAKERYEQTRSCEDSADDHCSMCGRDFCAIRTTKRINEQNAH